MTGPTRPRGGLLRHADFMRLWAAETISHFGSQVTALALPLVAIVVLGASAFEVALLATIEFLPFILLGLPAGVWVDRMRRRPILILGDLGRAAALATIPIAHFLGVLTMVQLYVVGFVVGSLTVFFDVAYQSYLPYLVDRDQLVEGNSKLEVSRSAAQIGGPGVAGVLVGLVTAPIAIVLDALSFVGSALFLGLIRRPEPAPARPAEGEKRPGMRREIGEGLQYVLKHRYLRNIAASTATANLFSNIALATFLVYAVRELRLEPALIGVVFAVGNIGFLLGAVMANRVARAFGVGRTIVGSAFLTGPALLLIPLAPAAAPVPFLMLATAVSGFSTVVYNVNQVSLRQSITPERMQGRMNATMRFVVWGTIPIGALLGGALATGAGLKTALWVGAIGALFSFLPVLFSPVRTLREMPEPVEERPAAEATATA